MARLLGVNLSDEKRLEYVLTTIYGIGFPRARLIMKTLKIDDSKRVADISDGELKSLQDYIEKNLKVEGDLREDVRQDVKRLREIGTYRGLRHFHNLPSRGQRTRSNARTKRGKRQTVGSLKKEDAQRVQKSQTDTAQKK